MKSLLLVLVLVTALVTSAIFAQSVNAFVFTAVGDIECDDAKKVADAIREHSPTNRRTLVLGDLGYEDGGGSCIRHEFIGTAAKPTVGNHDSTNAVRDIWDITHDIQTYKTENVRFLSLNTEQSAGDQKSRVQGLLNKYKNDTTIDFIIPYMHKPFITNSDAHHGESEAEGFRSTFLPMFVENGKVSMVMFGHNHNYLHCTDDVSGIEAITVGTGGRNPYSLGSMGDDHCRNGISGTDGYLEVAVTNQSMVGVFKDLNGNIREETGALN